MGTELFRGSKLKIERANKHIRELNDALNAFMQTDFYRLDVEEYANTRDYGPTFSMTREIPDEIPLVIGDAIHNLRTALDHVACELVTRAGNTPSNWTKFPFRETRKELEAAINGGTIKCIGPDIIALLLDVLQPYKGGNDPLYALHTLDIADKHRLLMPVFSVATLSHLTFMAGESMIAIFDLKVRQNHKLSIFWGVPGKIKIKDHGQPTFNVLFDNVEGFKSQPVVPTLHQLSQLVSGIVQTIEKAYLARSVP